MKGSGRGTGFGACYSRCSETSNGGFPDSSSDPIGRTVARVSIYGESGESWYGQEARIDGMPNTETKRAIETIDVEAARERLRGQVRVTPLEAFDSRDARVELRLKLECLQETNAFKARGAVNNIAKLSDDERARGVCATSSGNHGRALSWAAKNAGVKATIFMPANTYPNKIAACRELGAEVVLAETRAEAERLCGEAVGRGVRLVHPYKDAGTIEGAGTVGLELLEQWPQVDVVMVCTGGGGVVSGIALALARKTEGRVKVCGVEPVGSRNLGESIRQGEPVWLDTITTKVQGLCPPDTGPLNYAIVRDHVAHLAAVDDATIFAAQKELVQAGWTVEPAGAAALAGLRAGQLPGEWLEGRDASNPLRVACVVTGANPDPAQIEALLAH